MQQGETLYIYVSVNQSRVTTSLLLRYIKNLRTFSIISLKQLTATIFTFTVKNHKDFVFLFVRIKQKKNMVLKLQPTIAT